MARARNIKPGFFTNDELAQCEYGARLVFAGLWCIADREGRLEDRPLRIKAQVMPFDNCDVETWLRQLATLGFITRYEVANRKYIQVNNFRKHQNPHVKEQPSTIPAPDSPGARTEVAGLIPSSLIPDSLKPITPQKKRRTSKASKDRNYSSDFLEFWVVFPSRRKGSKPTAWQAWQEAVKRKPAQEILDAAREYAASPVGLGRYCKGPSPWLNQDCWDDDRAAWQNSDELSNGQQTKPVCVSGI